MFLGALLFGLLMCFTSCEDILGTWDKPASAVVTPSEPETPVKVTSITLDKTSLPMHVGDADVTLTATVAPDEATDKTVTWSSDKEAVATVDATGKVHAVAIGIATITATANDGSGIKELSTMPVG